MGPGVGGLVTAAREANMAIPSDKQHNGRKPRRLGFPEERHPTPALSPEDGPGVGRGLMERVIRW